MDYMFVMERGVTHVREDAEAAATQTGTEYLRVLTMKGFMFDSVFAYPVEGKGTHKAPWQIKQIQEYLTTCGLDSTILVA